MVPLPVAMQVHDPPDGSCGTTRSVSPVPVIIPVIDLAAGRASGTAAVMPALIPRLRSSPVTTIELFNQSINQISIEPISPA